MTDFPLVSAIMPLFQQERHVGEAFAGMLAQDYGPLEIVVVDDAATDRSFAIVGAMAAAYRGPHRIRLHRNDRSIFAESCNVARRLAQGEFLVVFHSDDVACPDPGVPPGRRRPVVGCAPAVQQRGGDRRRGAGGLLFVPGTRFVTAAHTIAGVGDVEGPN